MLDVKEWINKVTSALVRPNMWCGGATVAVSTTVSYDVGRDIVSTQYKTNTGRFVAIGIVPLKTSRYTSRALIKVDGSVVGLAATNKTSLCTVAPMATYNGTKGSTYTVALAIGSQDSGTTASTEAYNYATFVIFDVGGGSQ